MNTEIKIAYQNYIPDELINDFGKLAVENHYLVDIQKDNKNRYFSSITGSATTDIVIYIHEHTTEIIASGFINIAYDILKGGLKLLWAEVSKLSIKKLESKGRITDKPKYILVQLMDKNRSVNIVLEGDVDSKHADKIIDGAFNFISSEQINEVFNNPDFVVQQNEKPRIRIIFNREKQIWEPANIGGYNKRIAEILRSGTKNLNT